MTTEKIISLYKNGYSMVEIAEIAGVSTQAIHERITKSGIKKSISYKVGRRFWSKVDKSGDCWEWISYIAPSGYGKFQFNGKAWYSHRYSLSLVETLKDGLDIDHLCRNRACVRPSHLEQVTRMVNLRRAPKHIVHGDYRKNN